MIECQAFCARTAAVLIRNSSQSPGCIYRCPSLPSGASHAFQLHIASPLRLAGQGVLMGKRLGYWGNGSVLSTGEPGFRNLPTTVFCTRLGNLLRPRTPKTFTYLPANPRQAWRSRISISLTISPRLFPCRGHTPAPRPPVPTRAILTKSRVS